MSRSLFQNLFAASVLAFGAVACAESLPTDANGAEEVESSDELAQQFPAFQAVAAARAVEARPPR